MHLAQLRLTHFKNYETLALTLSPRLNCFTGLNGMGKTNVLDAVHLLCLARSHRNLPDRLLVQHGAPIFRVEGTFDTGEEQLKIAVKFPVAQRKEVDRNGVTIDRLADHVGQFPAVMIAPDDVSLVQDGSEERRRFLDVTLSQMSVEYLQNLLTYNALVKQRNALLKTFAEQRRFDEVLLESLDRQLPAPAQVVFEHRKRFVEDLQPLFAELYGVISQSREVASVRYESDLAGTPNLANLLTANLERDRYLERTSAGPHRDDLELLLNDQSLKRFASQGQLKSFLLALRLAQYELLRQHKGVAPLLLLDDIFDKLDEQRVKQLVGLLLERNFGQIFITDTQRSRIEGVIASFSNDYKVFSVENGAVV